jgi:hypothetical protein
MDSPAFSDEAAAYMSSDTVTQSMVVLAVPAVNEIVHEFWPIQLCPTFSGRYV